MSNTELDAIYLTIALASITTVLLLILGTPLAWWLSRRRGNVPALLEAVVAMPLILPPTVLGFYLLLLFAPNTFVGQAAATLGARPLDQFRSLVLPLSRRSFITAASLGFAHTVGEFGVVLMIGGNIPGETQVLSIALYDSVESLRFTEAHRLAGALVVFSLGLLFLLYRRDRQSGWRVRA